MNMCSYVYYIVYAAKIQMADFINKIRHFALILIHSYRIYFFQGTDQIKYPFFGLRKSSPNCKYIILLCCNILFISTMREIFGIVVEFINKDVNYYTEQRSKTNIYYGMLFDKYRRGTNKHR